MTQINPSYSAPVFGPPVDLAQSPNELITEIYSTGYVRDIDGKQTNSLLKSAIPFDQGMALYNWIRHTEARHTLEVGMAYGLSTLFICQAHLDNGKHGHHVAIDPKQSTDFRSIGLLNIQRAKLMDILEFFEAPSYSILPQLLQREERFDLVFIDGMHTFDYTLVDFFYSDLLLA
jgi:predicted O-methyltransferase YrrM